MKALIFIIPLFIGQVFAQSYSNVPADCIRDGVFICYGNHPAINSKKPTPEKQGDTTEKPPSNSVIFFQSTVTVKPKPINKTPEKCRDLRWRLASKNDQFATYRGSVAPGSADVIYLELKHRGRVIAQGRDYPTPTGTWEVHLIADRIVKKKHAENFYCLKY